MHIRFQLPDVTQDVSRVRCVEALPGVAVKLSYDSAMLDLNDVCTGLRIPRLVFSRLRHAAGR